MARSLLGLLVLLTVPLSSARARADVTAFFGSPGPCDAVAPARPAAEPIDAETGPAAIPAEPPGAEIARAETSPPATARAETGSDSIPTVAPALVEPETGAESTAAAPIEPMAVPLEPAVEPAALVPEPERSCAPVEIVRIGDGSGERAALVLVGCDGQPDAASLRELSLLARPHGEDRPSDAVLAAHESDADWVAPRLRRLDAGLLARLRAIADRFPGHPIEIVSGYRPSARDGSRHRFGRAMDVRLRGVEVAALDAFARTLDATGVGLYPTTDFIHVDVRARSAHWIDLSGPGEPPSPVSDARSEPEPARGTAETEETSDGARPASDGDESSGASDEEALDADAIGRAAAAMLAGFALDLG